MTLQITTLQFRRMDSGIWGGFYLLRLFRLTMSNNSDHYSYTRCKMVKHPKRRTNF